MILGASFNLPSFKRTVLYSEDLTAKEAKFFDYFRTSSRSYDELLTLLKHDITGKNTNMRLCIPPEEKLAVTLR
jgi:hypothetical protein